MRLDIYVKHKMEIRGKQELCISQVHHYYYNNNIIIINKGAVLEILKKLRAGIAFTRLSWTVPQYVKYPNRRRKQRT